MQMGGVDRNGKIVQQYDYKSMVVKNMHDYG